MEPFIPVQFGKYLLLDKIATGGMAELFKAKLTGAEGFEKLIAIKKILQHLNTEEKLVSSFIDEAKLAAFLHHPNIGQIYDFGCINDTYYIAMEYLLGKDLRFAMKKGNEKGVQISLENALYVTAQICEGLFYAHNLHDFSGKPLNIIHRDIGPQNIFITYNGQVKIIDFGIAKASNQNTNTQAGTIKGKVAYMSPEQAAGGVIDHRSDIYSIGIVLYELLTCKKMYEGDTFQVLAKAREALFEPPEMVNSNLPQEIYDILYKALEKNPGRRYKSAEDMCNDIEKFMLDNSIRGSQRELSVYMKELFNDEVEDSDIRNVITGESLKKVIKGLDDDTFLTEEKESATVENTVKFSDPGGLTRKKSIRLLIYIFFLFFSAGMLVYYYGGNQVRPYIDTLMNHDGGSTTPESLAVKRSVQESIRLVKAHKYIEAVELFEKMEKNTPSVIESVKKYYSEALTGMASGLIKTDKKKAGKLLEKSLEINPENSNTYFFLGRLYNTLQKNREAVEYYNKAAELDENNPDILFNLGYSHAVLDDYGKAKEMYQKVVDLSPPFVDEALFNIALIHDKTGRQEESIVYLKKALKMNPRNKNAAKMLKQLTGDNNK